MYMYMFTLYNRPTNCTAHRKPKPKFETNKWSTYLSVYANSRLFIVPIPPTLSPPHSLQLLVGNFQWNFNFFVFINFPTTTATTETSEQVKKTRKGKWIKLCSHQSNLVASSNNNNHSTTATTGTKVMRKIIYTPWMRSDAGREGRKRRAQFILQMKINWNF